MVKTNGKRCLPSGGEGERSREYEGVQEKILVRNHDEKLERHGRSRIEPATPPRIIPAD